MELDSGVTSPRMSATPDSLGSASDVRSRGVRTPRAVRPGQSEPIGERCMSVRASRCPAGAAAEAEAAVRDGLLRFPPPGESVLKRRGLPARFRTDTRGAGARLPLRALIQRRFSAALEAVPDFDLVAGVAKAGMPWAAWIAMQR